jgi:hypothetical protein
VLAVGGVLFIAIWVSIFIVRGMLLGQWGLVGFLWALSSGQWEWSFLKPMFTLYFQLSLWIVVCYFTIVRFLTYLDLRIRREGWEVELRMRAERARLTRAPGALEHAQSIQGSKKPLVGPSRDLARS